MTRGRATGLSQLVPSQDSSDTNAVIQARACKSAGTGSMERGPGLRGHCAMGNEPGTEQRMPRTLCSNMEMSKWIEASELGEGKATEGSLGTELLLGGVGDILEINK